MEIIIETPKTNVADIIQRVCADPTIKSDWDGFNRSIDLAKAELELSEDEALKLVTDNWTFDIMYRVGTIFA